MLETITVKPVVSLADMLRVPVGESTQSTLEECRRLASEALAPYGVALPDTESFELHLILALEEILVNGKKQLIVPFDPEFLFVMDCGFEALIGISLGWVNAGRGDPNFPDFTHTALRSIPSRKPRDLIFPNVAGSIQVVIKPGTPPETAKAQLEAAGLKDVAFSGDRAKASCRPFVERSICEEIERELSFVRYSEQNHIARIIDFGPGWTVRRLA
jgi:hypothetical protein